MNPSCTILLCLSSSKDSRGLPFAQERQPFTSDLKQLFKENDSADFLCIRLCMHLLLHLFILGDVLLPELEVGGLVIKQWISQCEMIYKVAPKITVTVRKLTHLYRAASPS